MICLYDFCKHSVALLWYACRTVLYVKIIIAEKFYSWREGEKSFEVIFCMNNWWIMFLDAPWVPGASLGIGVQFRVKPWKKLFAPRHFQIYPKVTLTGKPSLGIGVQFSVKPWKSFLRPDASKCTQKSLWLGNRL